MADLERERERERMRSDSDEAGVGPYARDASRLSRLSELDDWGIAEDEPDIRGWEVRTVSGRELGEVKDLLVDVEAGEVVMLDVEIRGGDRRALVPIRVVALDRGSRVVRMDSADLETRRLESTDREVPVPGAMEPAEVERRAEAVSGDTAEQDRLRERKREARYGDRHEVIVERRPVVIEETIKRRRTIDPDAKPDDRL